jgi:hypothetical protein
MTDSSLLPHWRQVALHYSGHVLGCYAGIPDVVWVDEDDGTFLVTAGACVTKHGGRRYAAQLHLFLKHVEQFAASLRAAASFTRRGANEDLTQLPHAQILCRSQEKSKPCKLSAFSLQQSAKDKELIAEG